MLNYRQRFYERYIGTHFSSIRDFSSNGIERQERFFQSYYGHLLPRERKAAILDLGCGAGVFLQFLLKRGYLNSLGVDWSREQVEEARRLGGERIHYGDLMVFLREHPRAFDCITAIDVIEHFTKDELLSLLDAVRGALKDGGILVLHTPNGASPFYGAIRYADYTHETVLTKESVRQVLGVTGFIDVRVYPTQPVVHGFLSANRWFLWQGVRFIMQIHLAAETGKFRGHILSQNLIAVARKEKRVQT